ncbi:MAG: metalloregulator ArsR/SmtB family transcription factor [Lachnospiraceae bacterium]|nr:metalloregulator ArsR/SmtB family transcription factor [Lachnospiraceae bacterium]
MKEKKKKKLAKLEKLEKQEKQKLEDKPKKKKKEKKNKLTETLSQETVTDVLPEAEEASDAAAPVKRSPVKRKKTAKHAQMAPADDTAAALLFRAMGDDVRLQIVQLIRESGELCAADLLKSVSIVQSTLSHHMKILCESGVVACRRQGKWSYYSIDAQKLEQAAAYLEMMAEAVKKAAGTEA